MKKLLFAAALLFATPVQAGTIVFEDWSNIGIVGAADAPLYRDLRGVTVDATTSTSAENYTTDGATQYISIYAVEAHRVSVNADTTGTTYIYIPAGARRDVALPPGATVYYRSDS